ncbi:zinc metallopeptidase [Schlesneria sp.]|uniref:zinc metallopeptidase n=1 Tax=Schlesneria sp. TaxID=2762018 RepID=UPI002F1545FE
MHMPMFDPMYFLFIAPGLLLSLWASHRVRTAFGHYSQVGTARGLSGAEAARQLLNDAGLSSVGIVETEGQLSDHYDPQLRRLALSHEVYHGRSVASIGVATHEAGHAIQHATNYGPLGLRSMLVPVAGIGSSLGYMVMAIGLFVHPWVFLIGVAIFSMTLLFQIVTLPVEFDASARAKQLVVDAGIILPQEREGMDKVLDAAALTYVAAAVSTLSVILYHLFRSGLLGGSRDDR